jgi:phosphoglycolate phosphatase-like HAD superfamily hydrolase
MKAVAVDLDGALGDTRPLWQEFLAEIARRFASIAPLDADELPADRGLAAAELDRWAAQGIGDWRAALTRFAEEHAPVFLRPSADASASLRVLETAGYRIGVFTDAPEELAHVALAHLGASRRVDVVEAGAGACERLVDHLGGEAVIAASREDLARIAKPH